MFTGNNSNKLNYDLSTLAQEKDGVTPHLVKIQHSISARAMEHGVSQLLKCVSVSLSYSY